MKKLGFVAVCLLIMLYACTKGATYGGHGTIYATVNGAVDTFSANVVALKDSTDTTFTRSVVGFKPDLGDSANGGFESAEVGFQITSPQHITAGTYVNDTTTGNLLTMLYIPANKVVYDSVVPGATNQPSVTITSITSTKVIGTFSGFAFYADSTNPTKATIANANFTASFP